MSKFEYIKLTLPNGADWTVARANIDLSGDLYLRAVEQSEKKAAHTMDASQSGGYRSPELKFNKQLMGTLAEIFVQEFIKEGIAKIGIDHKWDIIRYDDVRTDDFKSPENEYDIKVIRLVLDSIEYFLESRSSIVKYRSLASAISSFHIIGAYDSIAKTGEKPNDFYILPLHFVSNNAAAYSPSKYQEFVVRGDLQLYIVAGCSRSYLDRNGKIDNLNQGSTRYRVIKASLATDALNFQMNFAKLLEGKLS